VKATAIVLMLGALAVAQTTKPAAPAKRPATAKKPSAASAAQPAGPPKAIIHTSAGDLTCELFPDKAPKGVASFVGLARGTRDWTNPKTGQKVHGKPLYDGTICHRVIPEFMIQCGDPEGTGRGGPGYEFANETAPDLTFDQPGRLAYANAGPDTNGSQFFITEVATPFLNGKYTIFGQCTPESVELVKKIAREPRNADDRPDNPVTIKHITITGMKTSAAHPTTRRRPETRTAPRRPAPPQK
jgi:peptidyl-prolyl cis-trans isomerase A (cyclophilin A)